MAGDGNGQEGDQPQPQKKGGKGSPRGSQKEKWKQDEAAKQEVAAKLRSGEYVLELINEGDPLQSPAWKNFARVALPRPLAAPGAPAPKPQYLKFVKCRKSCGVIKMYNGGTGALGTHECNTAKAGVGDAAPPPKVDVDSFINKLIEFLAGNVLPLSLASADQFHALIQEALRIGHDHGKCKASDLIPHPTTLKRKVTEFADAARSALVEEMREDLEDGLCSATVDGWTDGQKQSKFLCHTVERIDKNFVLNDNVLFTPRCDAESVTAAVISEEIKTNLSSLSLDLDKVQLHYVTAQILCLPLVRRTGPTAPTIVPTS